MMRRVHLFVRLALWWFFAKVSFGPRLVNTFRDAAARGRVVYVMQSRSLFDQLYFNYAFLQNNVPLAKWSNGIRTTFLRPVLSQLALLFRRRDKRPEDEQLASYVRDDEPVLLFLERPLDGESDKAAYSQHFIESLIDLQREEEASNGEARPIVLVPMMIVWERLSEDVQPGVIDEIFGSRHKPGFFRKIFHVLKNIWQPFFIMGPPLVQTSELIELKEIGDETSTVEYAGELRSQMTEMLDQQRAVVVGPRFKKGAVIKRELLEDAGFVEELVRIADQDGMELDEAKERARKALDRIAADYSMLAIKFMSAAMFPVWHLIYDGLEVDEDGLERVREAARTSRIVVIPSHKSHMDYLVVSHAFFQHGLVSPHIVAGDNMNFPPLGTLFRRCGAFFIRRSFKGDHIYGWALSAYLGKLLTEGHAIEFFIEGGRSRTGKLLPPRFGMLRMLVDAFRRGDADKITIAPCAVTYERVIEGGSHSAELAGGTKQKESVGALINQSARVLTSKYGRLHVNFGELIEMGEYLGKRGGLEQDIADDELQRLTRRLGYKVIYEINRAETVTPTALASLALLSNPTRGMGRVRLLKIVGFILHLLVRKNVRLSPTVQTALASRRAQLRSAERPDAPDDTESLAFLVGRPHIDREESPDVYTLKGKALGELVDESMKLFTDNELVEMTSVHGKRDDGHHFFYSVPEGSRTELAYYKNMIVHMLMPEALLASALVEPGAESMELEPLHERTFFLSSLFKYEFSHAEKSDFDGGFWTTFEEFAERGWVEIDDLEGRAGEVRVGIKSPPLEFFRNLILTLIEAYALTSSELDFCKDRWVEERDLIEHLLVACRVHYHEGRVRFHETLAKPTFSNALRRYTEWGYLEMRTTEERRKKKLRTIRAYRLRPEEDHQALLHKLRCLLRTRPVVEDHEPPPERREGGVEEGEEEAA